MRKLRAGKPGALKLLKTCSVCGHKDVAEIDAALKQGFSSRIIERQYIGIGRASLSRHRKNHLGLEAVVKEKVVRLVPAEAPKANLADLNAIEQQRAVCAYTWKLVDQAIGKKNFAVATQNLRNLTEAIKALASLTGELEPPANTTMVFTSGWFDSLVKKYSPASVVIDLPAATKEIA